MTRTPGYRARVLVEHYGPTQTAAQAEEWVSDVQAVLDERFPGAVVATYIEENPPADELP